MTELWAQLVTAVLVDLGAAPILLFLAIMGLAPWVITIWAARHQDRLLSKVFERQDLRFEEVVKMYQSNVALVQAYESVVNNYHSITDNLQELVMITTHTQEKLVGKIENNRFCPLVRQKTSINIEEDRKA